MTEAYRKLHDSSRASAAVSKIEQAIGLSPETVKTLIGHVKKQAKNQILNYEQDAKIEKEEIIADKSRLQSEEESPNAEGVKGKLAKEEAKLSDDEQKEQVAKLKVNEIKRIEKILTIIEAAKFSALQRAKKKLSELKTGENSEIRKRDLEDLEKDFNNKRRRRNQITIWMKGSRNKVDTSHFLRSSSPKRKSWWALRKKSSIKEDERSNELISASDLVKTRYPFAVQKRTKIPKPELSIRDTLMLKMLQKMDGLFEMQGKILKELQKGHKHKAHKWRGHLWKKHKRSVTEKRKKRSAS